MIAASFLISAVFLPFVIKLCCRYNLYDFITNEKYITGTFPDRKRKIRNCILHVFAHIFWLFCIYSAENSGALMSLCWTGDVSAGIKWSNYDLRNIRFYACTFSIIHYTNRAINRKKDIQNSPGI
jgi:hypothetical protein